MSGDAVFESLEWGLPASAGAPRSRALALPERRAQVQLHEILSDLATLSGFRVAALSVLRPSGVLQMVGSVGAGLSDDEMSQMIVPAEIWPEILEDGERHGGWIFARKGPEGTGGGFAWVPDLPACPEEGRWGAHDTLNYPITDGLGATVGLIGLDVPVDEMLPDEAKWDALDRLGHLSSRALFAVLERERQAERARLAETARTLLRHSSAETPPEETLGDTRRSIEVGLSADIVDYQLFNDWLGDTPDTLIATLEAALRVRWEEGRGPILLEMGDPDTVYSAAQAVPHASDEVEAKLHKILDRLRAAHVMLMPVGSAEGCYGGLLVGRRAIDAEWSEAEIEAVGDIARDLGRNIASFHDQEREHQLLVDLQRVADYKSRLVATVSHDLVSPLSAIRLHLDLLAQTEHTAEHVPYAIKAMQRATQELLLSIESLLALYRSDFAHSPRERVDLVGLLAQVLDAHTPLAEVTGLEVVNETADAYVPVMVNRVEFSRVIGNLIGNAIKYTTNGQVRVKVEYTAGFGVFTCTDTGLGMSEDDQARVFDEFFRSEDAEVRGRPGTGLGLSIVARIVDEHDGQISLTSQLRVGTKVVVKVPLD